MSKEARRVNNDTWIVTVNEGSFQGVRLVTEEEWQKGWTWDSPWIERMILDDMRENKRRSNI